MTKYLLYINEEPVAFFNYLTTAQTMGISLGYMNPVVSPVLFDEKNPKHIEWEKKGELLKQEFMKNHEQHA